MLHNPNWQKDGWRKVLLDAADFIEEVGWIQNQLECDKGVCIVGALMLVGEDDTRHEAYEKLAEAVGAKITDWNDMPGRTKKQVLSALRTTAVM